MNFSKRKLDHTPTDEKPQTSKDMATKFLLFYLQDNGQSLEEKLGIFNKVLEFTGFNVRFAQKDKYAGWVGTAEAASQVPMAKQMRKDLERCFPRGKFEEEVECISEVISRHKEMEKAGW